MFTLKLYRNGPLPPAGRSVFMETAGVWVNHREGELKEILAFPKTVGVGGDYSTFLIGGEPMGIGEPIRSDDPRGQDNYYAWGVLENSSGKTTEVFR